MRGKDAEVRARFRARSREEVLPLIDDALIAEHERTPFGRHSDALQRVLVHVRSQPVAGKDVILCDEAYARYRIGRLTGVQGERPQAVDDRVYASVAEAEHAVFLRRIEELRR